jgi:AmiR/NasT family two-component response regulator
VLLVSQKFNSMSNQRFVRQWKFLFVNAKEEDTQFLTKDLPVEVIHTQQWERAEVEIKKQPVKGVFIDIAEATPENLSKIRGYHDTTIVMLASVADLPRAIEHVKHGNAHGFLIKGISNADSVLRLMQFASQQNRSDAK